MMMVEIGTIVIMKLMVLVMKMLVLVLTMGVGVVESGGQ